jgi:F-type H+-transporting ATPase subunit b
MTIDWWTLGLQTVNVLILVWLLGRFFWRPLAGIIAERRAAAQKLLTEAAAKRDEAEAALTGIGATRAGFLAERDAILAAAHEAAAAASAARIANAAGEVAALKASAQNEIGKARDAANKDWAEQASRLAVDIAERLVARLDGPAVRAAFLDWLLREIRRLPVPARQASSPGDLAMEAVSATPLDASEQERCRALIGEALGGHPRIDFRVDNALIAGLELHGPNFSVSNSWRADLTRIRTELGHALPR